MKTTTNWKASNVENAKSLGILEFQDNADNWHDFHVMDNGSRLVFGGCCNAGFLESGFMVKEECESEVEALDELLADLETFYRDGAAYVSRITCNDRM